jgi:secreted trypsin-like serine protease
MRRPPRLLLFGTLAALALLAPPTALAKGGGSVQPRVVGGSTASVSTYPWQAAVVDSTAQSPSKNAHQRQFCGGVLLTSRIVVTAGHCVADTDPDCGPDALPGNSPICTGITDPGGDGTSRLDPNDVDAVLGRSTLTDTTQGAEYGVSAVVLQANFDGDYQGDGVPRYDIAYLVLPSASGQTPIKIAGTDEGALWDSGSSEEVSGWGSTSEFGGTVDTLRSATVDVIPDSTCSSPTVYGSDFDSATMLCAGNLSGGVDSCFGDSGGPLQAPLQGGGYRLVGITGWGDGCARANAPGVYTRVAGPTMRSLIDSDVSSIDSAYGLPAEGIFGSGGQPRGATASPRGAKAAKALKKCKRIHSRKKRRRCVKRVKAGRARRV